jgi:hypothetical protein
MARTAYGHIIAGGGSQRLAAFARHEPETIFRRMPQFDMIHEFSSMHLRQKPDKVAVWGTQTFWESDGSPQLSKIFGHPAGAYYEMRAACCVPGMPDMPLIIGQNGGGTLGSGPTRNPMAANYSVQVFAIVPGAELVKGVFGFTGKGRFLSSLRAIRPEKSAVGALLGEMKKPGEGLLLLSEGEIQLGPHYMSAQLCVANLVERRAHAWKSGIFGDAVVGISSAWQFGSMMSPSGRVRGSAPSGTMQEEFQASLREIAENLDWWLREQVPAMRAALKSVIPWNILKNVQEIHALVVDDT